MFFIFQSADNDFWNNIPSTEDVIFSSNQNDENQSHETTITNQFPGDQSHDTTITNQFPRDRSHDTTITNQFPGDQSHDTAISNQKRVEDTIRDTTLIELTSQLLGETDGQALGTIQKPKGIQSSTVNENNEPNISTTSQSFNKNHLSIEKTQTNTHRTRNQLSTLQPYEPSDNQLPQNVTETTKRTFLSSVSHDIQPPSPRRRTPSMSGDGLNVKNSQDGYRNVRSTLVGRFFAVSNLIEN